VKASEDELKTIEAAYLEQVHDAYVVLWNDLSGFNDGGGKSFRDPQTAKARFQDAIRRAREAHDDAIAAL
jgi:hypothetical protein